MPTLDAQLRDSSQRLLRKPWAGPEDTQRLADEIYALLKNLSSETTGAVEINNGDTVFVAAPLDSLDLPFLDFDATTREEALGEQAARQPNDTQFETYRYFTRRVMLTAELVSRSVAGSYVANIYPNGFDDSLPTRYPNVREVQSRVLDDGTRVLVNRLDVIEATEFKLDNGNIEGTRIKLIRREHFFSAYDLFSYFDGIVWSAGIGFAPWNFDPTSIELNEGDSA
jgi:hypothetical protein